MELNYNQPRAVLGVSKDPVDYRTPVKVGFTFNGDFHRICDLCLAMNLSFRRLILISVGPRNKLRNDTKPRQLMYGIILIIRTFIERHKSRHIHLEAQYMSKYTCVVEL